MVVNPTSKRDALLPTLSLFASFSTLICCALPALLVTLGLGASLAGLVSAAPWLVALSKHKALTFGVSAALIGGAWVMRWMNRNAPCPADPAKAKACMRLRSFSKWTLIGASVIRAIGAFFAFLAADLLL